MLVEQRIEELVGMRDALSRLVATCERPRKERDFPLLHDIETATAAKASVRC
jgi:hypothetical protein